MCYRCSNYSPHLHGNRCPNCHQEYVFSYVSFEILPLAEFSPDDGISDQEAERLLMAPPKMNDYGQPDQFIHEVHFRNFNIYFNVQTSFYSRISWIPFRPAWIVMRYERLIPGKSSSSKVPNRCPLVTTETCYPSFK